MNPDKLAKLQSQVRIGGKGTARRKKKIVRKVTTTDDKKIQSSLKKLSVNTINGIEEVNMIKDDGRVINFNNPTVQASLGANTFAITGHSEEKHFTELLPGILNHLGAEGFNNFKRHASSVETQGLAGGLEDEEMPELVEDFEAASKTESATKKVEKGEEADDEDDEAEKKQSKPKAKKQNKKAKKAAAAAAAAAAAEKEKEGGEKKTEENKENEASPAKQDKQEW